MAATLLNLGNISPSELLARLQGFGTDAGMSDNIKAKKDGKTTKGSYYDHIRALFGLFELSDEYKYILRCMAYIPAFGIHIWLLGKWLRFDNINAISEVIEQGFIQRRPGRYISLHPLIRELVVSDLKPGIDNTIDMLDTIRGMCQLHGITLPFQRTLYDVIYNILTIATKDNDEFYLRFLEDTFSYIEGSSSAMDLEQLLFDEMVRITSDKSITILSKYELMGMHDSILQALNYSSVLVDMGDYEEALDLLLEVENIINHLDYTTFEHANTCHMIGITYLAMGRISEAKERFNQAMKIYTELFQDSPDAVYQKRGEISEHFLAMGLDEEAARFLNG